MINKELVNEIHSLLDKGVTFGFSKDPKPGNMCVEQVVSYALGEEINDEPSCVGKKVREFVVRLNCQEWSSDSARAEGMRDLAIAQLGSDLLNQDEFLEKISFAAITKLLPSMFRDLGEERWEKQIKSLEEAKNLKEAKKIASKGAYAADMVYAVEANYAASDAANVADPYSAYYASYAAANAALATKTGDKYLKMVSHLAVEVLKEMKSPGCQFL